LHTQASEVDPTLLAAVGFAFALLVLLSAASLILSLRRR
jgi:preprotein translocase subunit Sec61beta